MTATINTHSSSSGVDLWAAYAPSAVYINTGTHVCSANTSLGGYSQSLNVNWGNYLQQGGTYEDYFCLHNAGTVSYTIDVTNTLPSAVGTITFSAIDALGVTHSTLAIPAGGYGLVQIDFAVSPTAPLGQVSFAITFQ